MKRYFQILFILITMTSLLTNCKEENAGSTPTEKATEASPAKTDDAAALKEESDIDLANLPGKGELRQQIENLQNKISIRREELKNSPASVEQEKRMEKLENIEVELAAALKSVNKANTKEWPKQQQSIGKTIAKIRMLLEE